MMLGVLGSFHLTVDGREVTITAPKQRLLMALLAKRRNTPVRVSRICAELWPGETPESALDNLRTYVAAVRRSLAAHRDRLVTRNGSYLLRLADEEYDAATFQQETEAARRALAAGALPEALRRFASALRLCRDEPLQDVPVGPELAGYAKSLTESMLRVREDFLIARFESGETNGALTGLRQLAADHPSRESTWHALIRLCYQAGDRNSALDAFQDARRALADRTGLDPGPHLTRLHHDVLNGLPVDTATRSGAVSAPPSAQPRAPRQLPPEPQLLLGRDHELAQIRSALLPRQETAETTPHRPRIMAIHGIGGVGKSSLALVAAHRISAKFTDGQLYLDLRGFSPGLAPMTPGEALARLLRALGTPETQISPEATEAETLYRSITADRRLLLLLDNAVDPAQVRPLLPTSQDCCVLITSRRPFDTLDAAAQLRLGALSAGPAVELLRALAGADRIERNRAAAQTVARLAGGLPLALRIAALRVARHAEPDLSRTMTRLRHERFALDELGFADLDVRVTFEIGYSGVTAGGPVGSLAARIFRLLGPLQLTRFSCAAAAAAAEAEEPVTLRALDLLIDHGLIERVDAEYHLHDLLRLYAAELFQRHDGIAAYRRAATRLAGWYVATVRRSRSLYLPLDGDPPLAATTGSDPRVPQDMSGAESWLDRHAGYLGILSRQLYADPHTRGVAWELLHPLSQRLFVSYPSLCIELYTPLLADGDSVGHCGERVRALCAVSSANAYLLRHDEMLRHAERALELASKLDDDRLRARVLALYGTDLQQVGRQLEALKYLADAIVLCHASGRPMGVATLLNTSAGALYMLDRPGEALALLRRSLAIRRRHPKLAAPRGSIMSGLATVHLRLGHPRLAELYATAAITWSESTRTANFLVDALIIRSLAREQRADSPGALADAESAVAAAGERDSNELQLLALRNLAAIHWLTGHERAHQTLAAADQLAGGAARADGTTNERT